MEQEKIDTIMINDVEYIRKDAIQQKAETLEGMEYCIARTQSAGVFAGYVKSRKGKEIRMVNARRLWYWRGAASLSQLSVDGVSLPKECKFPCIVPEVLLTELIELLPCSSKAQKSIASVLVWEK